jgi:hypothetical protein
MVVYSESPLDNIKVCRAPEIVFRDGDILFSAEPLKFENLIS